MMVDGYSKDLANKDLVARKDALPKPPPLPSNLDAELDKDELVTIPAPPLESTTPATPKPSLFAEYETAQDSDNEITPDRQGTHTLHLCVRLPKMSSAGFKIALAAAIILLIALVFIFIADYGNRTTELAQPKRVTAKSKAKVVLQSAAEGYAISSRQLLGFLHEFTGGKSTQAPEPGQYVSLNKVWQLAEKKTASELTTLLSQGNDIGIDLPQKTLTYNEMWKLGMLLLDTSYARIDDLQKNYEGRGIDSLNEDISRMRDLLSDWLLGKRGVYCQVRTRYWQQIKEKNPPVSKDQKSDIRKLRKERQEFLKAAGRPNKPLYKFCDRDIL